MSSEEGGAEVAVYLYDLSQGMAKSMSMMLLGKQVCSCGSRVAMTLRLRHQSTVMNRFGPMTLERSRADLLKDRV